MCLIITVILGFFLFSFTAEVMTKKLRVVIDEQYYDLSIATFSVEHQLCHTKVAIDHRKMILSISTFRV